MDERDLDLLRKIETDGTVTVTKPFNTRGWLEMCCKATEELDRMPRSESAMERSQRWHEIIDAMIASTEGHIADDRGSFRFRDLDSWQAWADQYEMFDASIMLGAPNDHGNPTFWRNFVSTLPGYEPGDDCVPFARHELEKLGATLVHDGRFHMQHWRVDFPSPGDLVAFQLVHC